MPWRPDFFVPLDANDPRNNDRLNPGGERVRMRLNRAGGTLVDFVVQYETPIPRTAHSHAVVLRSDMTHAPHYDQFDRFGAERRRWLPSDLSPEDTVQRALDEIIHDWRSLRRAYYKGLR